MRRGIDDWPCRHRGVLTSRYYLRPGNVAASALYSGDVTPYDTTEQRWLADLQLPVKRNAEGREIEGRIARLVGIRGLIRMPDYHRLRPGYDLEVDASVGEAFSDGSLFSDGTGFEQGFLPPFVTLAEAARAGATSFVLTFPAAFVSTARILRIGDLMEACPNGQRAPFGHLYEAVDDCRTNAAGQVRVYFEPGLRAGLAAGDMIRLRECASVFRLAKDDEGVMTRALGGRFSGGLSLVEWTKVS